MHLGFALDSWNVDLQDMELLDTVRFVSRQNG